jgi:hypothetical protein
MKVKMTVKIKPTELMGIIVGVAAIALISAGYPEMAVKLIEGWLLHTLLAEILGR